MNFADITVCLYRGDDIDVTNCRALLAEKLRKVTRHRWIDYHNNYDKVNISYDGRQLTKFAKEEWSPFVYITNPFKSGTHSCFKVRIDSHIYQEPSYNDFILGIAPNISIKEGYGSGSKCQMMGSAYYTQGSVNLTDGRQENMKSGDVIKIEVNMNDARHDNDKPSVAFYVNGVKRAHVIINLQEISNEWHGVVAMNQPIKLTIKD